MSAGRHGPLRTWALIFAMKLASHWIAILLILIGLGLSWYFDGLHLLIIGLPILAALAFEVFTFRPPGFTVRPADEPELTALIRGVAERQGFTGRLITRIVPEMEASLGFERVEGSPTHVLSLGWPFITLMTADELSSVVSHELAHEAALRSRTGRTLAAARNQLGMAWPVPFVTQALLGASREDAVTGELEADRVAASTVGAAQTISALRRTAEIGELQETLVDLWTETLLESDEYPSDLYECMRLALTDPDVLGWIDRNIELEIQIVDPTDTHPTMQRRMTALGGSPAQLRVPGEPVTIRQAGEIEEWCLWEMFQPKESELRPRSIRASRVGRFDPNPDRAISAIQEALGIDDPRDALHAAVDRIDDGTWRTLSHRLDPDVDEAPEEILDQAETITIVNCVGTALTTPLIAVGWHRANPWLAQFLESPAGQRVDVFESVEQAVAGHGTARLRELIDAAGLGIRS